MLDFPTGNVTFLFTDIEGSTSLWERHPELMPRVFARHETLVRETMSAHGGYVYKMIGDAFQVGFASATDALAAALATQRALQSESWGEIGALKVRMALHTGVTEERGDDYVGPALNRVARLLSAGHGGQVLLTQATYELARDQLPDGVALRDMGERRLRDLIRPERVYQLLASDLLQDFSPLNTLDVRPNNLPAQLTSFVGRAREMIEIKRLLAAARLVTLTGTGGAGKTRLSLQVAADVIDDFDHGVWFVELAPLSDPALVPQSVASALGVREQANRSLPDALCDYARDRKLLLVLDNCEHLIEPCAKLAQALLSAAAHLKILASSRESLRVAGETTYRVPSLTSPEPTDSMPVELLSQYEAVRLFMDRAVAASPGFAITPANARAVAQICYRLDGIPLAIELAAARIKSLSVNQIAERLDERFRLLTGGARTALPRQQTLRALVDWSYDLLSEPERILWRRLSAFAGGWTLQAAETICADGEIEKNEILDWLTNLADKSLVLMDEREQDTRYRMLETVRQYGYEKLRAAGEDNSIRKCHADFFLEFAKQAEPLLKGPAQKEWLAKLEAEHDNLRSALAWSIETEPVTALQLAGALGNFWQARGYLAEGQDLVERALANTKDAPKEFRANGLRWKGLLTTRRGDYARAKEPLAESLELWRELGDQRGIASLLSISGLVAWYQGEYASAQKFYDEGLELFRALNDTRGIASLLTNLGNLAWSQGDYASARRFNADSVAAFQELGDEIGHATALNNLGLVAETQGDYSAAQRVYAESISLYRQVGEKMGIAYALNGLAHVSYLQGDADQARRSYRESLHVFQEIGDKRGIAYCLEGFAKIILADGDARQAVCLLAMAEALRLAIGAPLNELECAEFERDVTSAREQLDAEIFSADWDQGRAMTMERAIELALKETK